MLLAFGSAGYSWDKRNERLGDDHLLVPQKINTKCNSEWQGKLGVAPTPEKIIALGANQKLVLSNSTSLVSTCNASLATNISPGKASIRKFQSPSQAWPEDKESWRTRRGHGPCTCVHHATDGLKATSSLLSGHGQVCQGQLPCCLSPMKTSS